MHLVKIWIRLRKCAGLSDSLLVHVSNGMFFSDVAVHLTVTTLWPNSPDDNLMIFSYFSQNFLEKIRKIFKNCRLLKFLPSMLCVNDSSCDL